MHSSKTLNPLEAYRLWMNDHELDFTKHIITTNNLEIQAFIFYQEKRIQRFTIYHQMV